MKRCLHKLFTEALFVTARLEKTQITSGIWEGVHGIKGRGGAAAGSQARTGDWLSFRESVDKASCPLRGTE